MLKTWATTILLGMAMTLSAEEQEDAVDPDVDTAGVNVSKEADAAVDHKDATTDTPDVFIPTEDISEDIAVSFPVDI